MAPPIPSFKLDLVSAPVSLSGLLVDAAVAAAEARVAAEGVPSAEKPALAGAEEGAAGCVGPTCPDEDVRPFGEGPFGRLASAFFPVFLFSLSFSGGRAVGGEARRALPKPLP